MTEASDYYLSLGCCADPEVQGFAADILKDHYFERSVPDEQDGYAIVELKSGGFAVLAENQDYSGHG